MNKKFDDIFYDIMGDVSYSSNIIKLMKKEYSKKTEPLNEKDIIKDIDSLSNFFYEKKYECSEYTNVLIDEETEEYKSRLVYLDDIQPFITEKERKYLTLLSSSETEDFVSNKLEQYGQENDIDFSDSKLDVIYTATNPEYDEGKLNKAIKDNFIIIFKNDSYSEENLKTLFSDFFNEKSLFDKRKDNESIVKKCINNILDSKNKEIALERSIEQYSSFRNKNEVKDVSFENSIVRKKYRP